MEPAEHPNERVMANKAELEAAYAKEQAMLQSPNEGNDMVQGDHGQDVRADIQPPSALVQSPEAGERE